MPAIQPSIDILAADAHASGLPVVIGVPFQRGFLRDPANATLTAPSGDNRPVSIRALNSWPDGSVRWGLVTTLAREPGTHVIAAAKNRPQPPALRNPVKLTQSSDSATLDNGRARIVLAATGPGPIREITGLGHRYLNDAGALRFNVNDADTTREQKRTIEVLENSPLRAGVRIHGAHFHPDGSRFFVYRLDAELWAGWPALRIGYHFFHTEPGKQNEEVSVNSIGMHWDLALPEPARTQRHFLQMYYTTLYIPREVFNPAPVALVTDDQVGTAHVENPAMLMDDLAYPAHLRPPLVATPDWMGIGDGQRSVYLRMHDFMQMRPKRLRSNGPHVSLDIWPETAGTLRLPQGRSRYQSLTITFGDDGWLKPAVIEQCLAAPLHEGRAVVTPAWMRQTGEFEIDRCMAQGAHVRFEKTLARICQLQTPQDMFNLGDTIDSGYCRTYLPIPNNSLLKRGAPTMPRVFLAGPHNPFAPWAFPEFYEPVWTNNEYDAVFAVCTEMMRTGRGDLWNLARWFARHNIEVDFVHYHDDPQQNRATPQHSANHNRSGAVPSHFWTQGLLQYYCLTGDADVLEIAKALGDKIIEDFTLPDRRNSFWGFTRELGWPALALAHLVDITGEARYARQLDEVLAYCMSQKRTPEFDRALVPGLWAWSCMFEGADLYQRRTGRKDIAAWLEEFTSSQCKHLLDLVGEGKSVTIMAPMVMAIGYERTGDKRFLRAGLACVEEFMDMAWWASPPAEVKPMAIMYRGLVRYLHHATKAGVLDHLEYVSARSKPERQPKSGPKRTKPKARITKRQR